MLSKAEYIKKAQAASGKEILASIEVRFRRSEEILGQAGLLATTGQALVFIEDNFLSPGAAKIIDNRAIQKGHLQQELIFHNLNLTTNEGEFVFGDITDSKLLEEFIRIAHIDSLLISPTKNSPQAEATSLQINIDEPQGFAPQIDQSSAAAPQTNKVPSDDATFDSSFIDALFKDPQDNSLPHPTAYAFTRHRITDKLKKVAILGEVSLPPTDQTSPVTESATFSNETETVAATPAMTTEVKYNEPLIEVPKNVTLTKALPFIIAFFGFIFGCLFHIIAGLFFGIAGLLFGRAIAKRIMAENLNQLASVYPKQMQDSLLVSEVVANFAWPPQVTAKQRHQIMDLLVKGHKIAAIKLVRSLTGIGLKEAKELTEQLQQMAAGSP